jgi:hypothetical protein
MFINILYSNNLQPLSTFYIMFIFPISNFFYDLTWSQVVGITCISPHYPPLSRIAHLQYLFYPDGPTEYKTCSQIFSLHMIFLYPTERKYYSTLPPPPPLIQDALISRSHMVSMCDRIRQRRIIRIRPIKKPVNLFIIRRNICLPRINKPHINTGIALIW